MLANWAEMGGAAAKADAFDDVAFAWEVPSAVAGATASRAGFSFAAIDF